MLTLKELEEALSKIEEKDFIEFYKDISNLNPDYQKFLSGMAMTYVAKIAQEPSAEAVQVQYIMSLKILEKIGVIKFQVDLDWK